MTKKKMAEEVEAALGGTRRVRLPRYRMRPLVTDYGEGRVRVEFRYWYWPLWRDAFPGQSDPTNFEVARQWIRTDIDRRRKAVRKSTVYLNPNREEI